MSDQHEQLDLLAEPDTARAGAIVDRARDVFRALEGLPDGERIDAINAIRLALSEHSPMRDEPVDCVLWVSSDTVAANDYNPNVVAPPEMDLLKHSILADGYTQPIVGWRTTTEDDTDEAYEIVDGFHRHRVGKEARAVRDRVHGRLPLAVIRPDRHGKADRMAATVRHNRARGRHVVDGMSDLVLHFRRLGKTREWIADELGMQLDQVLKYEQVTGLAENFADEEFSEAWEPDHQEL